MDNERPHQSARAEWHRLRAARERQLAEATNDFSAYRVHLALAELHERASEEGYALQVAGDR